MKKESVNSLKIAFCLWLIMNISGIQKLFFLSEGDKTVIAICKILHIAFLYLIINNIKRIITDKDKRELIYTLLYVIILSIFLLLVWPGTWSWDDVVIVSGISKYNLYPWQHFISAIFQILCVQTIPIATGVMLIQILIAGMIVGYCIKNLTDQIEFKTKKSKLIAGIIMFIPCISPPLIEYILSGFRMGIYAYLDLLLIVKLYLIKKENKKLSNKQLVELVLLSTIVASWRTEAIYYIVFIFMLLMILGKKIVPLKKAIIATTITAILVVSIGKINTSLIGNNNYKIAATIMPVTELVKTADKNKDAHELKKINKVLKIEMIYKDKSKVGEELFFGGIVRDHYTKKDYKNYMQAYLTLITKYPKKTLDCMLNMFIKASGMSINKNGTTNLRTVNTNSTGSATRLFNTKDLNNYIWEVNVNSKLKHPINTKLRNKTINKLTGINNKNKVTITYYIFWNTLIPIILIITVIIYSLVKKRFYEALLGIMIMTRIFILFLTECAPYFMYYLSFYLISYIYFYIILGDKIINKLIIKKSKSNK